MKNQWQKLLVKLTIWLATEILLNLVGLDNLADCSEFLFSYKCLSQIDMFVPNLVAKV
jgi:hypothetical protein